MDEAADVAEFIEGAAPGGYAGSDGPGVRTRDDRPARDAVADYASRLVRLAKLYAGQKELILPGRSTQGLPCARFEVPAGAARVWLPGGNRQRLAALFGPALGADGSLRPDAASRPTILFFYGNAMCLSRSVGIFQHLRQIGANVMVPEYAGFGLS